MFRCSAPWKSCFGSGLLTFCGYAAGRGFEIGSLGLGLFDAEFQLLRRLVGWRYGSK